MESLEKLETLMGQVEDQLYKMRNRLPKEQQKKFTEEVLDKVYNCNSLSYVRASSFFKKEDK